MSVLERFADIVKANVNDLLDKCEDPAKMVDQYLREMTDSLAQVNQEAAGVIAEETRTKRLVDENNAEIQRYQDLAKKALSAGNEDDARSFLAKVQDLTTKQSSLESTYQTAHENADKMRQMHDKLVNDIQALNAKREGIKAKVSVAKAQETVTRLSGSDDAARAMSNFDRMEAKADEMLDKSSALVELDSAPKDSVEALASKYDGSAGDGDVDAALEALKKEMGLA